MTVRLPKKSDTPCPACGGHKLSWSKDGWEGAPWRAYCNHSFEAWAPRCMHRRDDITDVYERG